MPGDSRVTLIDLVNQEGSVYSMVNPALNFGKAERLIVLAWLG